jgi:hypothetical protein
MMPRARLSPIVPPAAMIREAVQMELQMNPPKVSAVELGKLPDMKQRFRLDECATILAVSNTQVRSLIDEGVLEARAIASTFDPENPPKKICKRVTRESVVRLLNDTRRTV